MVELTFYGGLREIGGTKILLRTDSGSIFIDFGKSFALEGSYFEEPWNPPFYIPSLLKIGALPAIDGLYRMNAGKPVDGVLISHAHVDHCGHVPLLSPQIPVYAGEDTKNLIEIRSETYDQSWGDDYSLTDWRTFRSGDAVEVEGTDISFTPIHVDHSVPASYGFIIEAEGKRIAYTGDVRMHGRRRQMTEDFLQALRATNIDVLLCEGTHAVPEGGDPEAEMVERMLRATQQQMAGEAPWAVHVPCTTEDEVEAGLRQTIGSAKGLVLVEIAPIDLDRLFSVWQATAAAGRTLVLPSRLAYILLQARRRTQIRDLPDVLTTGLYLSQLKMRKDRRQPGDPLDTEELVVGRRHWEQQLAIEWVRDGGLIFGLPAGREALTDYGGRFVICSPQVANLLPELCYGGEVRHVTFILSKSGPFNSEMAISFGRLQHWLALFGCRHYYHIHVSGHSPMEDLNTVIEAAAPGVIVPIHTRHPEMFEQRGHNVMSKMQMGESVVF